MTDTYVTTAAVHELFADDTYQRPLDAARARKIAAAWDRRLAGILDVSDRGEATVPRYAVIDGQHRWAAASLLDTPPTMVVNVHTGLTVADEAALFDRLNRERRRITTWDHWHARKTAGDPTVTEIEQAVSALGLKVDPAPQASHVRCTATLEKLHALGGVDLVTAALNTTSTVWGRNIAAFDADIVHGLGLVIHFLHNELDGPRLVTALTEVAPRHIKSSAYGLRDMTTGTMPKLVAIAVVSLYNRRPGRKIAVSVKSFGGSARNAHSAPGGQQ